MGKWTGGGVLIAAIGDASAEASPTGTARYLSVFTAGR